MIIITGCNKGGAGKSTTAVNVAVALAKRGADVCLVDADKQRSSAKWHGDRQEANQEPEITLVEKYDNISKTLTSLDKRFDFVIVDVEGSNSRELITGASVADIIIAPHQYSQFDMDTLEELEQQIVRIRDFNPTLKVYIYQAKSSTHHSARKKQRAKLEEFLADFEDFTLLKSIGCIRNAYIDVLPLGLSVVEYSDESAKKEIEDLINEVLQ